MNNFGKFIARKSRELGLNYSDIDIKTDKYMGSTSKYVRGDVLPNVISLIKMTIALDLKDDEIVEMIKAIRTDAYDSGAIWGD